MPEALAAAVLLDEEEGVDAGVLVCSSADRLYRCFREARLSQLRDLRATRGQSHLEQLFPAELRTVPLVTAIDGASRTLAGLGACLGLRTIPLGVDRFGQVGSLADLYEAYDLSAGAIAMAALIALET